MSAYFRKPCEFHIMSLELATVITVLNKGRTGGLVAVAVHANSKGYRITFQGRTVAAGKTLAELQSNFKAAVDKAKSA